MNLKNFLSGHGVSYSVMRSDNIISHEIGLPNHEKSTGKQYIGFEPLTDIQPGDCLVNSVNEKVYVIDTRTSMFSGKPFQLMAYYETEVEHNRSLKEPSTTVFNIGSASNSVIGNNNVNTLNNNCILSDISNRANAYPEDREQLQEIIDILTAISENQQQPHGGVLSKFSGLMEKHSWLTSSVLSFFLNFLTQQ